MCPNENCSQMFRSVFQSSKHNDSVHLQKRHRCPECDGMFKNLASHKSDVHGMKKLSCEECNKAFNKTYDLKIHISRNHSDENRKIAQGMGVQSDASR